MAGWVGPRRGGPGFREYVRYTRVEGNREVRRCGRVATFDTQAKVTIEWKADQLTQKEI